MLYFQGPRMHLTPHLDMTLHIQAVLAFYYFYVDPMVSPSGPPHKFFQCQPQAHTDHLVTLADMHSTPQGHCVGALRLRPWNLGLLAVQ